MSNAYIISSDFYIYIEFIEFILHNLNIIHIVCKQIAQASTYNSKLCKQQNIYKTIYLFFMRVAYKIYYICSSVYIIMS